MRACVRACVRCVDRCVCGVCVGGGGGRSCERACACVRACVRASAALPDPRARIAVPRSWRVRSSLSPAASQVLVEFMFHQQAVPRLRQALAARGVSGAADRVRLMPKASASAPALPPPATLCDTPMLPPPAPRAHMRTSTRATQVGTAAHVSRSALLDLHLDSRLQARAIVRIRNCAGPLHLLTKWPLVERQGQLQRSWRDPRLEAYASRTRAPRTRERRRCAQQTSSSVVTHPCSRKGRVDGRIAVDGWLVGKRLRTQKRQCASAEAAMRALLSACAPSARHLGPVPRARVGGWADADGFIVGKRAPTGTHTLQCARVKAAMRARF